MADIKLVIKISEDLYEAYKDRPPMSGNVGMDMIAQAIANGTPLPKGHGDLVDRNRISKVIYAEDDNLTGLGMTYNEMDFYNDGINSMWDKLQNAAPVIEADKTKSEE